MFLCNPLPRATVHLVSSEPDSVIIALGGHSVARRSGFMQTILLFSKKKSRQKGLRFLRVEFSNVWGDSFDPLENHSFSPNQHSLAESLCVPRHHSYVGILAPTEMPLRDRVFGGDKVMRVVSLAPKLQRNTVSIKPKLQQKQQQQQKPSKQEIPKS